MNWLLVCDVQGVRLRRYVIHESRDKRATFYVRPPLQGVYYLTVYARPVSSDWLLNQTQFHASLSIHTHTPV